MSLCIWAAVSEFAKTKPGLQLPRDPDFLGPRAARSSGLRLSERNHRPPSPAIALGGDSGSRRITGRSGVRMLGRPTPRFEARDPAAHVSTEIPVLRAELVTQRGLLVGQDDEVEKGPQDEPVHQEPHVPEEQRLADN